MIKPYFVLYTKTSLSMLMFGLVFLAVSTFSNPAYALTAGCNPTKWADLQNLAEVRVAYDIGATEEIIPKPDSVLALTCFAQASQESALKGGSIFSGDFTPNLDNVIQGTVEDMLGNFAGSLLDGFFVGAFSGMSGMNGFIDDVSNLFFMFHPPFSCDHMQDIWNDTLTGGINGNAPFMDLESILTMSTTFNPLLPPDPGNILGLDLAGSSAAALGVQASIAALPIAIPVMDTDTNVNGHLDVCDVMTNLIGSAPAGC